MATSQIASNPPLPYVGRLPGGFTQGASLQIDGCMNHGRFNLNIMDTADGAIHTPFHMSFRSTEHCIVRNHRSRGSWGAEERDGGMPVQPGQHFRLTIEAAPSAFVVSFNDVHFGAFNYRMGLETAQFLNIHGDVQIYNIVMANHNHIPPIAICPPFHPNYPTAPIMPPVHPHPGHHPHHHHGPHHGCPKLEKKLKKEQKKQEKREKKDRKKQEKMAKKGRSCSCSSSSSSD